MKNRVFFSQPSKKTMDSRQLNAFLCVFEERNITAAARRLHLTQPALSATIKALEDALGTQLFVRLPRGVEVTSDARTLYPQAQRMLAEAQALTQQFRHHRDRLALSIGIAHDIADEDIAALAARLQALEPRLLLTLEPGCSGHARLAPEDDRCEDELFLPLREEAYALAVPHTHALAGGTPPRAEDLASASWITCPADYSHQRLLPLYGAMAAFPAAQAGTLQLALGMAAAGMGLTIAPRSLILQHPALRACALPGGQLTRRLGLCYSVPALAHPVLARLTQEAAGASALALG